MSDYRNDCFCTSYPCDQQAPFNGIRWGCPPLTGPKECDVTTVALRAGYPTPTPTPEPTPTPTPEPECAQPGQPCSSAGCCNPNENWCNGNTGMPVIL